MADNEKEAREAAKSSGRESRLSFKKYAEHQLRQDLKDRALELCDPVVKEFAQCSQEKGLMVVFSCRPQFKKVQECMEKYNGEDAWQKYKIENQAELDRKSAGVK